MRNLLFILIALTILGSGCQTETNYTPAEVVEKFAKAYNENDYVMMGRLLADSLVLSDFTGFTMARSKDRFLEIASWGAVFDATMTIESMTVEDNKVFTVELQDNEREQFLTGNAVLFQMSYLVEFGQIAEIFQDTLPGYHATTKGREEKYRQFLRWVAEMHPEEIKMINKITPEGAEVFKSMMKAYNSYEKEE